MHNHDMYIRNTRNTPSAHTNIIINTLEIFLGKNSVLIFNRPTLVSK